MTVFVCRLDEAVQTFIDDPEPDPLLNVGADMRKIHYCFRKLRVR